MKFHWICTLFLFIYIQVDAQITSDIDTWQPIGNTELRERFDDLDNGDGLNDGAIEVDGKDNLGPLGVLYTFQGVMEQGAQYQIETTTYKFNSSYVNYFVQLYNLTDEELLISSPLISLGTNDTPADFEYTELLYDAEESDVGDILQLRYVRENTEASNHVARDFAIDNVRLNGTELAHFDQVFAPKPILDIPPVEPSPVEMAQMDEILAELSDLKIGSAPPTAEALLEAVEAYNGQEIVVTNGNISGVEHTSKSDWAQANYLKTFAKQLKFNPDDPTVYANGLTIAEMAVNTIWMFAEQYYRGEIPFDFINYSYKLYASPAVFLSHLLDDRQYGLLYYSLYRHSRNMKYYWAEEYITGLPNTGSINEDDIFNISDVQLAFGLIQETPIERLLWTKCFKRYYERFMQFSPATTDGIKPDGSSFHHASALNNYTYCYNTPSKILPLLQGTPFQISEIAYKNLRLGVYGQLMVANQNVEPLSMVGRHPQARNIAPNPDDIASLAVVGGAILGLDGPDPVLANAHARHWVPHEDLPDADAETLEGFIQLNYHTGAVYWKNDWMISTRGQTNWGFGAETAIDTANAESSLNRNIYGRYQSYGTLEVIYPGGEGWGNGFAPNNWNWNYNPGATTIVLPWELLKVENSRSQRELQRNGFTGSLAFDALEHEVLNNTYGACGVFGMDFLESLENNGFSAGDPNNHDTTFTFKKSVFFFRDYVLALSSGIHNSDEIHPTVTTLSQRSSFFNDQVYVDGELYSDLGTNNFEGSVDHWLIDNYSTGYYIVAEGNEVVRQRVLTQIPQYDQYDHTLAETNPAIDNTITYIDHGVNPENGGYEYLVFPQTDAAAMADFASQMQNPETKPYEVIQKNEAAHIVRDIANEMLSYALFSSNDNLTNPHLVKANDTPCLIIYEQLNSAQVKLALSNPNLGFSYRSSDSSEVVPITVTLRGLWDLASPHPEVGLMSSTDSTTTFQFDSYDGMPIEIMLEQFALSTSEHNPKFKLYPNPAQSVLNIQTEIQFYEAKIFSTQGKHLKAQIEGNKLLIDHLSPGNYILQLQTEQGLVTRKFAKL